MPRRTYDQIVADAAETAIAHIRGCVREGDCSPARLYYQTGRIMLQSEGCRYDATQDGWIKTDKVMPLSVPYEQYSRWIRDNAGQLPIFGE